MSDGFDIHLDAFAKDVKYVSTKAFPLGFKRLSNKRILIILTDTVLVVDAEELKNTIESVMEGD